MSTDPTASYEITNIALAFDMVTNSDLARRKRQQYMSRTVVLNTRILRHRKLVFNKRDVTRNINLMFRRLNVTLSCTTNR